MEFGINLHGGGRKFKVIQVLDNGTSHAALRAERFQVIIQRNVDFAMRRHVFIVQEHAFVNAKACRQSKPARVIRASGLRQHAVNLKGCPESLVAVIVRENACFTLSVIRFGIDPIAPLQVHILEHGNVAFCHGQKATQRSRKHIENAKAPFRRKAVLHVNRHMRCKRRKTRIQVSPEFRNARPAVAFVKALAHHDTRCKMAELVQVQRVIKIVFEMEIVPLFVPPALIEHKPIGGTVSNQNRRGNTDGFRNRKLNRIARVFTAVIPRRIAPRKRIARGSMQGYPRKHEQHDRDC